MFKKNFQLSGFSAYLNGSPSLLTRITGVLQYLYYLCIFSLSNQLYFILFKHLFIFLRKNIFYCAPCFGRI